MSIQSEQIAHSELVGGGQTSLHSHAGGGSINYKAGSITTNGSGVATVTFNTASPSTNYAISLTPLDPGDAVFATYDSKATTGFGIQTFEDKGQSIGSVTVDWVAIEYSDP
jgi:hypothetical protein